MITDDISAVEKRKPKYPVIDPNPSFTKVVRNFNFIEGNCVATIVGTMAYGCYITGFNPLMRNRPAIVKGGPMRMTDIGICVVASASLCASGVLSYAESRGRLMGFQPKDDYGSEKPQYHVIDPNPPFTKIVRNFDSREYRVMTASTGLLVSIGYALTNGRLPKRPSAVVAIGLLGLQGGLVYAHHRSDGRLKGYFPNGTGVAEEYEKQEVDFKN